MNATVPLYLHLIEDHPRFSARYKALTDPDYQVSLQVLAEHLLGLSAPVYTSERELAAIAEGLVSQINYLLDRGVEPTTVKSISNATPGMTTAYRDRYVDPMALACVRQATGRVTVGFSATGPGV